MTVSYNGTVAIGLAGRHVTITVYTHGNVHGKTKLGYRPLLVLGFAFFTKK